MGTKTLGFGGPGELLRWCRAAPAGTRLDAAEVARILVEEGVEEPRVRPGRAEGEGPPWTWRERLWSCPPQTRMGTEELAEALGRPRGWIYQRTHGSAEDPLPHRKLDGSLTFVAGEVREWLREKEEVMVAGRVEEEHQGLKVLRGGGGDG